MKRAGTTTKTLALEIEALHQSARDARTPEGAQEFALKARQSSLELLNRTKPNTSKYHEAQSGYALSLLRLGIRLRDTHDIKSAETTLLEALELYRSLGDQRYIMHTLHSLGMTYWKQLRKSESLETLLQALSLADEPDTIEFRARILNSIGLTMIEMNEPTKALEYHKEALALTLEARDKSLTAHTELFLGLAYRYTTNYSSAIEHYIKALNLFIEQKDYPMIATIYDSLGKVYYLLKRMDDALEYYLQGIAVQQVHFPDREIPDLLSNIGTVYHQLGDLNKALEYFHRAQVYMLRKGDTVSEAVVTMNIGTVLLEAKQYSEGLQCLENSLANLTATDSKLEIVTCLFNLGKFYTEFTDDDNDNINKNIALKYLSGALVISEQLDNMHLLYESHEALYKFHKKFQNLDKALYHFEQYHDFETRVFNEDSAVKLNNLQIIHQVEKSKQEAEFYRQLTVEFSRKNQKLEELNTEKNMFLGVAAHDLKNPLMNISMISRILADSNEMTTEEVREFATDIHTSSQQMFELIKNLLDVNAIESNSLMITTENFDFVQLLKRLIRLWQHRAQKKDITLSFIAPTKPIFCLADSMLTYQIMENLLSNAVKYSSSHTTVHLRVYSVMTDNNSRIRFEVKDEGPGISSEDKSKLFNKFARLSAHPTGGEHSTGLGLAIVKKITEAMNGTVWCESEYGNGATFIVELPATE